MSKRSGVGAAFPRHAHGSPARLSRVTRALVSPAQARALAETFSLLGDPTRTRLLHALSVDELCVSDLAGLIGLSASAVSHQLRLLRDRRLVAVRREGKHLFYRLQDEHIRTLVDMGLSHVLHAGLGAPSAPAARRRVR
jgi:ArsR family transcriptional regulator, lead/cadmium/zinc/bismuth-responsive transcriptional repressor